MMFVMIESSAERIPSTHHDGVNTWEVINPRDRRQVEFKGRTFDGSLV